MYNNSNNDSKFYFMSKLLYMKCGGNYVLMEKFMVFRK